MASTDSAAGEMSPMGKVSASSPLPGSTPRNTTTHGWPTMSCPFQAGNHSEPVCTESSAKACSPGVPRAVRVARACSATGEVNSRLWGSPARVTRPLPWSGTPLLPEEQVTPGRSLKPGAPPGPPESEVATRRQVEPESERPGPPVPPSQKKPKGSVEPWLPLPPWKLPPEEKPSESVARTPAPASLAPVEMVSYRAIVELLASTPPITVQRDSTTAWLAFTSTPPARVASSTKTEPAQSSIDSSPPSSSPRSATVWSAPALTIVTLPWKAYSTCTVPAATARMETDLASIWKVG